MARCYSEAMRRDQPPPFWPLPNVWLLSDARNDAVLEQALADLPAGSGFVYRHYHLGHAERRARFGALSALCRDQGHAVLLAGRPDLARSWSADGVYGAPGNLGDPNGLLRLATAHDVDEISRANRANVDGLFLSPVFSTRSHLDGASLGAEKFHALAALAECPVIALGGMTAARAEALGWPRWAAIDGLLR